MDQTGNDAIRYIKKLMGNLSCNEMPQVVRDCIRQITKQRTSKPFQSSHINLLDVEELSRKGWTNSLSI